MKLRHKITRAVVSIIPGLSQTSVPALDDGKSTPEEFKRLCRESARESIVMLKNDNNVLPVKKNETISIFGRCQVNYFFCGYGSGGDVKAPYKTNVLDGFRQVGAKINEELAKWYEQTCIKDDPYDGFWGFWPYHYDEFKLEDEQVKKAASKSDVAIVVIGRSSGEDRETKLSDGSWYLTKDERALLTQVRREFKKVVALVNGGNYMDYQWIDEYKIDSVLHVWQGGQESGGAIADVVMGISYPSGHLADTVAKLYNDQPSKPEFGLKSTHYIEDIFVGYRYFETFAPDRVRYPFGFGLGYTTFETTSHAKRAGDDIVIECVVKNVGSFKGKEVVQCYYGYEMEPHGHLAHPKKTLIRYHKTKELEPGQVDKFELRFHVNDMMCFDDTGATHHNQCWVVEAGKYPVYVGNNVRAAEKVFEVEIEKTILVEKLEEACGVKDSFKRITNRHGKLEWETVPVSKVVVKDRIAAQMPKDIPQVGDKGWKLKQVASGEITMEQFISQLTDEQVEALTRGNQGAMFCSIGIPGNAAVFGGINADLRYYGIPTMNTNDGPSGNRFQNHTTLMPIMAGLGATWNDELLHKLFLELGKENQAGKSQVMLAPAINIHRNPLCGRNYEYFSEDPYLTSRYGIAYVNGLQEAGASACIKHFACNNQEKHRWSGDSIVSQRALREIYLRPFEMVIKTSHPHWVMSSYNRVNGILNAYNFDLLTTILRNQWGFDGVVMTDWWVWAERCPDYKNIVTHAWRIRAGNSLFMPGSGRIKQLQPSALQCLRKEDGLHIGEIQREAMRICQYIIDHFPERMDDISIVMPDKYDTTERNKGCK